MKKLAGLIIILAVLILGGYYGMGVLTERTIKKNIEIVNQSSGLFAQIVHYNRGWFCSNAQIKWRVHIPERIVKSTDGKSQVIPAQDYNMEMPVKIHHGPIIYANRELRFGMGYAETVFAFPKQYDQKFAESFSQDSTKPQLDLSIFVNYLNKSTMELSLPTFKLISKDGTGHFDWMGMESTTTISSDVNKIEGGFVVDGVKITKDDTQLSLGKVSTDFSLHRTTSGLYLGNASFSLPEFDVLVKDKKMFEIREFTLSSESDIQDKLFSTHFNIAVKSILANGLNYGPGYIELSLRNLDADVLAEINKQATDMQNGTDAERQKAMLAMLPQLPKLFSKGAEFELSRFNLKIPEGMIDGHLIISLPKGDSSNPFELMQKIHGNAKLKMPKAVVKQLTQQSVLQQMSKKPDMQQALIQQMQSTQPQQANQPPPSQEQLAGMQADKQIATMEQNGLITSQGSDYVTEVSLDQGKFTVNGKPFDPAMVK